MRDMCEPIEVRETCANCSHSVMSTGSSSAYICVHSDSTYFQEDVTDFDPCENYEFGIYDVYEEQS